MELNRCLMKAIVRLALIDVFTALVASSNVGAVEAKEPGRTTKLSAELTVETDGPLLAEFPIQLKLTITNLGDRPLHYWCGGPGDYPGAHLFTTTVTDGDGKAHELSLHNGQYVEGSGTNRPIKDTKELPVACRPLPAGTYVFRVECKSEGYVRDGKMVETWPAMISMSVRFTVKKDPSAVTVAERELIARAKDDPFAKHVSETYGIAPVIMKCLKHLLQDDPSFKLVGRLQHVRRLPEGGDVILKQAAIKHCHPKLGSPDKNLLRHISLLARGCHSDDALDAMITIARADVDNYARQMAVRDLAEVPSKRAEESLILLAKDKDSPIYWDAIYGLANRGNPFALAPLLEELNDEDPARRVLVISLLSGLRNQPAAKDAIISALKDPSPLVREKARQLLSDEQ